MTERLRAIVWIAKGLLLGLGLFSIGLISCVYLIIRASGAKATGMTVITGLTLHNPLFWLALAGALITGCAILRCWHIKPSP